MPPNFKGKPFYLKDRYNEISKLCADNGYNLDHFLKLISTNTYNRKYFKKKAPKHQARSAEGIRQNIERTKRILLSRNKHMFIVHKDVAAKFRIICIAEHIPPRYFLEALLNAFIEGEPAFIELMKVINKYHDKFILKDHIKTNNIKRIEQIQKIMQSYGISDEWYKQFADLRVDEIDF